MKYLENRIEVILRDLKKLMILDREEINIWKYKEGYYIKPKDADKEGEYIVFDTKNDFFKGKDNNYWFTTNFNIPHRFLNKDIYLEVKTQATGGGCQNPAFLLFIDEEIIQGMDTKHEESLILKDNKKEKIRIDLQTHTGFFNEELKLYTSIYVLDNKIKDLYYDIYTILLSFEWLDIDSNERIELLYHLNETINLLDLREPYSDSFYSSLNESISYIRYNIYEKMSNQSNIIATCIGHTHIDVAWRWTVEQSRAKVSRSFSTVVKLMDEYSNFKFLSSQPILYQFLKDRYVEIYEKVKKNIKLKKWEAEGGMYLEADTNLTSGESLIRQFYYGTKFFRDEFDIESNKILWLPDVFGYSGNLPQIMKKCGIKYFMTTKLAWNQYNKIPNDTFIWEGIDGSKVLTHLITTTELKQNKNSYFTTYNGMLHPDAIMGGWNRYQNKNINNNILISYGYGDGGGGPTREMLEISKRMEKGIKGIPKVEQKFAIEYFENLEKKVINNKRLQKWVGELYFEYHRGTLTSMGRNKRDNRKSEYKIMNLEFLLTLNYLETKKYNQQEIDKIWKKVLLNQFHDILPGSSIKEVYDITKIEYEEIFNEIEKLEEEIYYNKKSNDKITLINNLSFNRNDYINLREIIGNFNGKLGENIVQNGISYVSNIPSKGYITKKLENYIIEDNLTKYYDNILETNYYTIKFDEFYNIVSLYDKENEREIVQDGGKLNEFIMYEDKPMWHDNWDIDEYYTEKQYKIDKVDKAYLLENGPIYSVFRIEKSISNSKIIQDMYLYKYKRRIDFKTEIDYKTSQHLLKVHFPVDIQTNTATFDIQFGHIERPIHKNTSWDVARFEVSANKYVDLSEGDYGVAILNNCKYGHSINDKNIGLTLVKAGNEPNPVTDIEKHFITYSILPHIGNHKNMEIINESYMLNNEVIAKRIEFDKEKFSFLNVDKENIVVETIKKAYFDDAIIIRIYESQNIRTKFNLKLYKKIKKVYLCDALENNIEELGKDSNNVEISIKPLEFITIKVEI